MPTGLYDCAQGTATDLVQNICWVISEDVHSACPFVFVVYGVTSLLAIENFHNGRGRNAGTEANRVE